MGLAGKIEARDGSRFFSSTTASNEDIAGNSHRPMGLRRRRLATKITATPIGPWGCGETALSSLSSAPRNGGAFPRRRLLESSAVWPERWSRFGWYRPLVAVQLRFAAMRSRNSKHVREGRLRSAEEQSANQESNPRPTQEDQDVLQSGGGHLEKRVPVSANDGSHWIHGHNQTKALRNEFRRIENRCKPEPKNHHNGQDLARRRKNRAPTRKSRKKTLRLETSHPKPWASTIRIGR